MFPKTLTTYTDKSQVFYPITIRYPNPLCPIILVLLIILFPRGVGAFDDGSLHLSLGVGLEQLNYQEHIDMIQPDNMPIESDANINNQVIAFSGRVDLDNRAVIGAAFRTAVSKGSSKEKWYQITDNNGSTRESDLHQTNELEYSWLQFDIYGGYRFSNLVRFLGGVRVSRAEQFRHELRDADGKLITFSDGDPIEAIERINSNWFVFTALGEQPIGRIILGYSLVAGVPLSVKTTNSIFRGVEFTDVGGWMFDFIGRLLLPISSNTRMRFDIGTTMMHWNGSNFQQLPVIDSDDLLVQWPENDTRALIALASLELML
jgi:hypothetical protein